MERVIDWLIPFVLGGVASAIIAYIRTRRKQQTANDMGTQCLLRAEIIRDWKEYTHKGYCPYYAKEALDRAYKAYEALGGNDVAHEKYLEVMALPDELPKEGEEE